MHVITIVGDHLSGKTSLCEQWSGSETTTSYCTTISVTHYYLPLLTLHDTPSSKRFHCNLESWYMSSDVIVIVSKEDKLYDEWYARISPIAPHVTWVMILNGVNQPKRRLWAMERDIRVFQVDLKTGDKVCETLTTIRAFLDTKPPVIEITTFDYYWCLFLSTFYNFFGG